MVHQGGVAVRIAVPIEAEPYLRHRGALRRASHGRGRTLGLIRFPSRTEFLPERHRCWRGHRGILLLQRLQLTFQLTKWARQRQVRSDKKRPHKQDHAYKHDRGAEQKPKAQAGPASAGGIRKDEAKRRAV